MSIGFKIDISGRYQNFGVLAREDEFEPHVYKEMLKGPRGVLLLKDMESRVLAKIILPLIRRLS